MIRRSALLAAALLLSACSGGGGEPFVFASGSENDVLEPVVQEFCREKGMECSFRYQGSLDIGLALASDAAPAFDAVWPASGVWIDLYDRSRRVDHLKSVAQMPVVLAVPVPLAESLGWTKRPEGVPMADILDAVRSGRLRYAMTSATQSNSGAMAYLSMLSAASGSDGALKRGDLDSPTVRSTVRDLLKGVERSAGSSSFLADLLVEKAGTPDALGAMWNYEAVVKQTNEALAAKGQPLLWAVYPTEGAGIADSPLGFVSRNDEDGAKEAFFLALQEHLLSAPVQERIAATGRRLPLGAKASAKADPAWNFDPSRTVTGIRLPEPDTISAALDLYQSALRLPSLTALCLDRSGSMDGDGIAALRGAMDFVLDPSATRRQLVQWSPADRIVVIPFDSEPGSATEGSGTGSDQARLRAAAASELNPGGGTDMYACGVDAVEAMRPHLGGEYLPALVMMTDGRSDGGSDALLAAIRATGRRIPVFGITFGDADRSQLDALAAATGGRVFDGRGDLTSAFRSSRGYN